MIHSLVEYQSWDLQQYFWCCCFDIFQEARVYRCEQQQWNKHKWRLNTSIAAQIILATDRVFQWKLFATIIRFNVLLHPFSIQNFSEYTFVHKSVLTITCSGSCTTSWTKIKSKAAKLHSSENHVHIHKHSHINTPIRRVMHTMDACYTSSANECGIFGVEGIPWWATTNPKHSQTHSFSFSLWHTKSEKLKIAPKTLVY